MNSSKYLAVFLCTALLVGFGARAEDLEAGKALGQSLGASGAQQAPGVTESATVLNDTMGHESTQGAGSGSGHDRGYTGAATYTSKLACAEGRTKFFGGFGLKVASCTLAGERVSLIGLSFCTGARGGAVCQWSAPSNVLNPGSTTFGDFTVNVSCPDGGTICEVSVREQVSQTWNADTVAEQGRQSAQSQGEGGFYDSLNTVYNDGNYRASLSAVGPQYSGCVEQVDAGLESDGIVYSCDGAQNASFDTVCEETRECVREGQQITRYDVDCVSGIDLVEQTCTTVTPTRDCEVSLEKQTYSCNKTLAVTATPDYNSWNCVPGQQLGPTYRAINGLGRESLNLSLFCDTNGRVRVQYLYTGWAYPNYNSFWHNDYLSQAKNSTIVQRSAISIPYTGLTEPPPSYPSAWSRRVREIYGNLIVTYTYAKYDGNRPAMLSAHGYRRGGYLWFLGSDCYSSVCVFNFRVVDEYLADDSHYPDVVEDFSITFPAPVNYTYTDSWTDGCTTYKNAK